MEPNEIPESPAPRVRLIRHLWAVLFTAGLVATLFTSFTPLGLTFGLGQGIDDIFSPPALEDGNLAFPTPTDPARPRIGIVAGHWGNDDGAVCPDGLKEVDVNLEIATRVQQLLVQEGFDVDLLKENDARLSGYRAMTMISIHADTCAFINMEATGFKVAATLATARQDKATRLVACIYSRYSETTGLPYHASITGDMTSYHAFEEIHVDTIAAIIETGFLNLDRQILTKQPDLIAEGIVRGLLCYINNEDASPPTSTNP